MFELTIVILSVQCRAASLSDITKSRGFNQTPAEGLASFVRGLPDLL